MVLLAFLSNHYMCGDTDVIAYLTKADADYIFDSLTVLLTWRFLVSYMLGYGKKWRAQDRDGGGGGKEARWLVEEKEHDS